MSGGRLNESSGTKPSGMLWSSHPGEIGGLERVDETGESDLEGSWEDLKETFRLENDDKFEGVLMTEVKT
jgi:hypothetical protein